MPTAPNINNYYIGKGILSFKPTGAMEFRDLGNVVEFEWQPELEKLEHRSSREGVRTVDLTVIVEKKATVRISMDEWSVDNLALAMLGEISQNTEGQNVISIFSTNSISGELKFVSTNEVGPKYEWHILKVDFIPESSINPLSDEFAVLEVVGDVAAVNGQFGTITELTEETETA